MRVRMKLNKRISVVVAAFLLFVVLSQEHIFFYCLNRDAIMPVKILLEIFPKNIDAETRFGDTPLQLAVESQDLEMVKLLLNNGASLAANRGRIGDTVHFSAFYGTPEVLAEIIQHLDDINVRAHTDGLYRGTPLHSACSGGRLRNVHLLIEAGADVNAVTTHDITLSVLHYSLDEESMSKDKCEIIMALIENGADLAARDAEGKSARGGIMSLAKRFEGYDEIVETIMAIDRE